MDCKYLIIEQKPHRLDITLNHPPVNILTGAVMWELTAALDAAAGNETLRAVVIKGEGKAWSAGADVSEHLPGKFEEMLDVFCGLCEKIRTFPIPTIAAVDGLCLGGGCEVALMCDFVLASARAKFGQPEIKVGVFPPAACAHFASKIGWQNAMQVILTGEVFPAEEAVKLEMATRLFPIESFNAEVDAFASRLTSNSAAVLRAAKRAALVGISRAPEAASTEVDRMYRCELMETADAVEGLKAFLEKRPVEWKDK